MGTSGTNRLLVVAVHCDSGDKNVGSVAYQGIALSQVANVVHRKGKPRTAVYRLASPPTGSNAVAVTLSEGEADKCAIAAISYTGVDQTTPMDVVNSQDGHNKTARVSVGSEPNDLVQGMMASISDGPPGSVTGNPLYSVEMGGPGASSHYGAGSTQPGASSVTTSWSLAEAKEWVAVGFNLNVAGAGP